MPIPLRLLMVEDRAADAELILDELRRAGYEPNWKRVETEQEFQASLQLPLDLILADFQLPQFDGRRALSLLRASALDIPFILVSGAIGEDVAVLCMKEGATDYLLKDRLTRLGPSVAQALEQKRLRAEQRRAEQTIRDSERRFRALIEHSNDAVALISPRGTILYESAAGQRVLGYVNEERVGSNLFARTHPADVENARRLFEQLTQEPGGRLTTQLRERHKDGDWRWLEINGANLFDEPSVQAIVWNYRDISERRRAEEAYRTLVEQSLQGIIVFQHGQFVFANQAFSEIIGYTVAELLSFSAQQVTELIYADDRALVFGRIQARLAGQPTPDRYEFRALRKNGAICWLDIAANLIEYRGEPSVQVTIADVTERKQAEESLRQSEQRARILFAAAERQARELALLDQVRTALSRELDLPALFRTVVEAVSKTFGYGQVSLYLLQGDMLLLQHQVGYEQAIPQIPISHGICGRVSTTRQPVLVADVHSDPAFLGTSADITSEVCVPLFDRGQIVGTLNVESTHAVKLTEADLRLMTALSEHVSIAIGRARLFAEIQRRAAQLQTINQVGQYITTILDPELLLRQVARVMREVLNLYNVTIGLVEADAVVFRAGDGGYVDGEFQVGAPMPVGQAGIIGWVAASGQTLLVPDVSAEPRYVYDQRLPQVRSKLVAPIKNMSRMIGVLDIQSDQLNAFTQEHVALIESLASQIAVAIENARLFAETRRRLNEFEAINKISSALRLTQTLDQMLPILLDETLATLDTTDGCIQLYDAANDWLYPATARGWFTQFTVPLKPAEAIAGHVFASGQPYLTHDFKTDLQVSDQARPTIPPGWSGVTVPLRAGNIIVGIMLIAMQLPREPQADESHLLSIISEIAGNAIHRVRLFEETERRVQRLAALHKVDMAITSSADLRVTLSVLLDQITTQVGIHAAAVLLLDTYSQSLEYIARRGFHATGILRARVRLADSFAGRVALERRMVVIPNLNQIAEPFTRTQPFVNENFAAYFGFPLIAKGEVKGVLELFHRESFNPDPEWLEFLETLAGQTAIALDNTALFDKLQRSNLELVLAYDTTLEGWSRALDLRDKETEGHTLRVTDMALHLARAMGLSESELVHMRRGALLHDIGKMGIPDSILLKPGPLNEEEWSVMRMHPVYAYELLTPISYLRRALDIPYCHHEKWDGMGYPRNLKGEAIPITARIFAVVDVWDALRSDRPYRNGWPEERVREHLRSLRGTHFESQTVDLFLKMEWE